jgi:hypothetical protein
MNQCCKRYLLYVGIKQIRAINLEIIELKYSREVTAWDFEIFFSIQSQNVTSHIFFTKYRKIVCFNF